MYKVGAPFEYVTAHQQVTCVIHSSSNTQLPGLETLTPEAISSYLCLSTSSVKDKLFSHSNVINIFISLVFLREYICLFHKQVPNCHFILKCQRTQIQPNLQICWVFYFQEDFPYDATLATDRWDLLVLMHIRVPIFKWYQFVMVMQ